MKTAVSTLLTVMLTASAAMADTWFTLADYTALKARDGAMAELVLKAMHETVFYAQESMSGPIICASPVPLSGKRLAAMLEAELTKPTNTRGRTYENSDHVAFIFMHALRTEKVCK